MSQSEIEAFRATVVGRVQGVGFRYNCRRIASTLGVTGWVRNEADGSVEVHGEGPHDALDRFAAFLRQGPPGSRVDAVNLRPTSATSSFRSFTVDG